MPTPNLDFRLNPQRAINFFGPVGNDLVNRLAPEILRLRGESEEAPITVLINSDGGDPRCTDFVYSLLTTKGASGKRPKIITVAVGNAASAAANMLTLGDYAIAYPKADIHFHGLRFNTRHETSITKEVADLMADQLEKKNRATAALLARKGTERMAFHYARLKGECDELKESHTHVSEIECFAHLLKSKLSHNGQVIVQKSASRWKRLRDLSTGVLARARASGKSGIAFESEVFRGVIAYEIRRNRKNESWALNGDGVMEVVSDYLLLREYDLGKHVTLVRTIMDRFRGTFFSEVELNKLRAAAEIEKDSTNELTKDTPESRMIRERLNEVVKPLCYFTTSIWQALQEEENPLTPTDAYWLGAVDEAYGTKLPCIRTIAEADNPEQEKLPLELPTTSRKPV